MAQLIIQYVLIVLLVIGLAYLIYILKDKGLTIKDDYFGIAYTLLNSFDINEVTNENVKKILRVISEAVHYVESNYKNDDNLIKEARAYSLSKEAINSLNFSNKIDEEVIRQIIRISAALLPPTNKVQ